MASMPKSYGDGFLGIVTSLPTASPSNALQHVFLDNGTGVAPFGRYFISDGTTWLPMNTQFAVQNQYTAGNGASPLTLTGAQVAGAQDVVMNVTTALGAGGTLNTPTAAQIIAAIPSAADNETYRLRIINSSSGAFAWTLTAGTGVTLNGTMTINQNTWRDFYVTVTSVASATVTIQSIGTGTFS